MAKNNKRSSIGKSLLYNRGILYFMVILALGYLFYLSAIYDFYTLTIFVIIAFLTTFFSKNMIVILSLAMAVSFVFKFGTKIRAEGFEEGSDSSDATMEDIKKLVGGSSNDDKKKSSSSDNDDKKKKSSSSSDKEDKKKSDENMETATGANTANIADILAKMKDDKSTKE